MGIKQYHLMISGRVQGVSYRVSAYEKGLQLGLTGWVRNRADGRVEMLIQGQQDELQQMIEWADQGPRFAEVTNLELIEQAISEQFNDFQIR
jgi:acylphosphatase